MIAALCLLLVSADATADRSLYDLDTSRRATAVARDISRSIEQGNTAVAAISLREAVAVSPATRIDLESQAVRLSAWAAFTVRSSPALQAALRSTASDEVRKLRDEPLEADELAKADVWAAAVGSEAMQPIVDRLRDAGQLALARRCARKWGLAFDEPAAAESIVWPGLSNAPHRVDWAVPIKGMNEIPRQLRMLGARPRLTRQPVVVDDAVFVRRYDDLVCYDAETLVSRWRVPIPVVEDDLSDAVRVLMTESVYGTPVVEPAADGWIRLVHDRDIRIAARPPTVLMAIRRDDRTVWRYEPPGASVLAPGVRLGRRVWTVIETDDEAAAVAVDADTGRELTRLSLASRRLGSGGEVSRQAAAMHLWDGRLMIALNDGLLAAVDPAAELVESVTLIESSVRRQSETIGGSAGVVPRRTFNLPTMFPRRHVPDERTVLLVAMPDWSATNLLLPDDEPSEFRKFQTAADVFHFGREWSGDAAELWDYRANDSIDLSQPVEGAELREGAVVGETPGGVVLVSPSWGRGVAAVAVQKEGPTVLPPARPGTQVGASLPAGLTIAGDNIYIQQLDGLQRLPLRPTPIDPPGPQSGAIVDAGDRAFSTHPVATVQPVAPIESPSWPSRRPVVTEARSLRKPRYEQPLAVDVHNGALLPEIAVSVLRGGEGVVLRGPGLSQTLVLPQSGNNRRHERRLDQAWHRGRYLILQIGTELAGIELTPQPSRGGVTPIEARWCWAGGPIELFDILSVHPAIRPSLHLSEERNLTGLLEFRSSLHQPVGQVVLTANVIVIRQGGTLAGIELATGRELWRNFNLPAGGHMSRLRGVEEADICIGGPTGGALFASGSGKRVPYSATQAAARDEPINSPWDADLLEEIAADDGGADQTPGSGDGADDRPVETKAETAGDDDTVKAAALAGVEAEAEATAESPTLDRFGSRRLILAEWGDQAAVVRDEWFVGDLTAVFANGNLHSNGDWFAIAADRQVQVWNTDFDLLATVAVATPTPTQVFVIPLPDALLVGVGTEASPGAMAMDQQPASAGRPRPSLTGELICLNLDGTERWRTDVENIAVDLVQPPDLPVVIANFVTTPGGNPQSQASTVRVWDRRTGDVLFDDYRRSSRYQYSDLIGDVYNQRFTLRLHGRSVQFDYSEPPPAIDDDAVQEQP